MYGLEAGATSCVFSASEAKKIKLIPSPRETCVLCWSLPREIFCPSTATKLLCERFSITHALFSKRIQAWRLDIRGSRTTISFCLTSNKIDSFLERNRLFGQRATEKP